MAAARSKAPAIGSAQWILDERHQSNDLVSQELEDFGFSVRNELDWLNEHMLDIFAHNGQNNLDVFKTPGKLRGKTPHTARKRNPAEPRQPLSDLMSANSQQRQSPAQQSLQSNLQKSHAKARFQIAQDVLGTENVAPSPAGHSAWGNGKENRAQNRNDGERTALQPKLWSPVQFSQDTVMTSQQNDIFSPQATQSTQPTQATPPRHISDEEERRDTGDSFVSAKEAFASKNASKENLHDTFDVDAMDVDDDKPNGTISDTQDTVVRHELSSDDENNGTEGTEIHHDLSDFPKPPRVVSEAYSISADTYTALETANERAHAPEPKVLAFPDARASPAKAPAPVDSSQDDTVVHHQIDHMDVDDDVRSPSDGSSPVKPIVRKSSLTFASLPAREPLLAKKSLGNRVSRTSHVDQSKVGSTQFGRFTGGKSLGASQLAPASEVQSHDLDVDEERLETEEGTKIHNKTSTQRLYERINMLKQQNEAPKRASQNTQSQPPPQASSFTSSQPKELTNKLLQAPQPTQSAQGANAPYPNLPAAEARNDLEEDDDDDWISPIRPTAPASSSNRPPLNKSYSADDRPASTEPVHSIPASMSNPDLSTVVESTTPAGSPAALRVAKDKIIGSSAASAQVKLDQLGESPMRSPVRSPMRSPVRPRIQPQHSDEDIFTSPKRNEKAGPSIFSHLRSPSKESAKSGKSSKTAAMPGSPGKEDGRRTRSSSERERQKEKEAREKEAKQKQRADDKLKEMREKEQTKAAAQFQKSKAVATKPVSSQQSLKQSATAASKPVSMLPQTQSRPGMTRTDTASRFQDQDSADEMPPPPPPNPNPTHKALREPKKLAKASSKEAIPKAKPQKIMVNLNSSRYGQAPPPAPRPAPTIHKQPTAPTSKSTVPTSQLTASTSKSTAPAPKPMSTAAPPRPASALSSKSGPSSKPAPTASKSAPRINRPQQPSKANEKPKVPAARDGRADLPSARPVSRMQTQTVTEANRINVPPVNPAKPPKRPFQNDGDDSLHRPAKRPSQQAKTNPITPAHSQFAKGKIPFAESSTQPPQQPQIQYQNGEEIKLPDIMTDSEDDDSDNDFEQPSWVNTPNLRELLSTQQLVDPEQIFGPIAPLNMEQVFPNKERHKRFRERTSSAYWTNDQITEEEKRKEREARERLVKDGAWTYNPSPRPGASH